MGAKVPNQLLYTWIYIRAIQVERKKKGLNLDLVY